jgi:hypothetical protein
LNVQFFTEQEKNMSETKPWFLSRTIWASLVTVGSAVAAIIGVPVAGMDTELTDAVFQTITAVSGLIAIIGRLAATTKID